MTALAPPRPQDDAWRPRLNGGTSRLTRPAALVVVGAIAWMLLEWGSPSPTIASPERTGQETDGLPMVAQAQATPPADAVRPADLERQRAEAARKAEQDAAARRAEQQIRRLQDGIFRQADEEAAARKAQSRRGEPARPPQAARSRPQEVESVKPPAEATRGGTRIPPPSPIAPATPAPRLPAISAQEISRIQSQAEQRLRSRGLFRESSADRWGVTAEVGPGGDLTLDGLLRDTGLRDEALRLVREIPGVQAVTGDVRVAERSVPGVSVQTREQIQQKLRSRGLLRESSADRWGVSVEVSADGDIKLVGALRDAGLQREAIRLAQEVAGARPVTDEISVMERADRQ